MKDQIEAVTKQVLVKITPKAAERAKVDALSRELEAKIKLACQQQGISATVRVEGSVAKDTWLSENPDIDVFMRLPTTIPREKLGDIGLKIAKKAAGNAKQVERFAEHPYLQIFIDEYRVDIVPCYDAKPGEWQSATDRTPYHTDYIKSRLSPILHGEVRLLKRFMQGIGVYGAEIKVGGFSGYLSELLIIRYGSFVQTIEAFAGYDHRVVIDIESFYANRERDLSLLFPEPLVIVDPVDKGRNVASAVQPQKLYDFIAASRAFQAKPAIEFFYRPQIQKLSPEVLRSKLTSRGSAIVFLVIGRLDAIPDVLWGQLYRSQRSLRRLIELHGFKVIRDGIYSNEKTLSTLFFDLEQQVLPNVKRHLGPPLERKAECKAFLAKYADSKMVISGPYVEEGRWIVILPRKTTDVVELLKIKLADGGKNAGIADLIANSVKENMQILVNAEVVELYSDNEDFAEFLTVFLTGKPFWLKA